MSIALAYPLPMPTVSEPESTVSRARAGDRVALRKLYDDHVDAVHGYCLRFCRGDAEAASELTQEAFTTAFARLDGLREDAAFPGWLMTTTRRLCLRWIEGRQREQRAMVVFTAEPRAPVDNPRERVSAIVREVIEACPDPGQREAARLFYTPPPRSTAEVGEALGISRTAVTTRLMRFRQWARQRMLGRLAAALEEGA